MRATIFHSIFILLFFLLLPSTFSLGMSPGKEEIAFQSNFIHSSEIELIGEGEPFSAKISVIGDMEQYVSVSTVAITVPPEGTSFTYTLTLPETLRPGKHKTTILIEKQASAASGAGKSQFGALGALGYVVVVAVPYEGKYAEATLEVPNGNIGRPLDFTVKVTNYGTEDIQSAQGRIAIYDIQQNKIAEVETDARSILQGSAEELYAHWTPLEDEVKPGVYLAKAAVTYDSLETEAENSFQIGDLFIDIVDLIPKEFESGKINKITIPVQSYWSSKIENVYATLVIQKEEIKNDAASEAEGTGAMTITTAPLSVSLWGAGELVGYWDAPEEVGTYTATVTLHYEGKTTAKEFSVLLKEPSQTEQVTTATTAGFSLPFSLSTLSFFGFALLLFFLLSFFFRKSKKDARDAKPLRRTGVLRAMKATATTARRTWTPLEFILMAIIAALLFGAVVAYFKYFAGTSGITGYAPAISELTASDTDSDRDTVAETPSCGCSAAGSGQEQAEGSFFAVIQMVLLLAILALLLFNTELRIGIRRNTYDKAKVLFLKQAISYLHNKEARLRDELAVMEKEQYHSKRKKRSRNRKNRISFQKLQQKEEKSEKTPIASQPVSEQEIEDALHQMKDIIKTETIQNEERREETAEKKVTSTNEEQQEKAKEKEMHLSSFFGGSL